MKFQQGQVVYVRDEGSLAVVDNPCTDKGNVTLLFYPSLLPTEKRNPSRNNRCGGLLQDESGAMYFDKVVSARTKEDRTTQAWHTCVETFDDYCRLIGYRVLPVNSPLIDTVPQADAEQFLENRQAKCKVVKALEQKNKTSQYENSNISESLLEEAVYLEAIMSELQK